MTIVETHVTVSHRYYKRRAKTDTAYRIHDLHKAAHGTAYPLSISRLVREHTAAQLADIAMSLHGQLPE